MIIPLKIKKEFLKYFRNSLVSIGSFQQFAQVWYPVAKICNIFDNS